MDNEKIYGKVFYEYSFYRGIYDKPNCIVNFDVIYLDDFEIEDD